jgi:hypothetical protein
MLAFLRRESVFQNLQWYAAAAKSCEADGFEFRPTQLPMIVLQLMAGTIPHWVRKMLISGEQSYISEHWPWEWYTQFSDPDRRKIAAFSYLLMPHKDNRLMDRLFGLRRVGQLTGYDIPMTFYPNPVDQKQPLQPKFKHRLYQPGQGLKETWKFGTIPGMVLMGRTLGYTGVNLDIGHLMEIAPDCGGWNECIRQLLEHNVVREVQLPILRSDIKVPGFDTNEVYTDLVSLTKRSNQSQIWDILHLIFSHWSGPVIIEVPPMVFQSHEITTMRLKQVVQAIRFAHARATIT